MKVTVRGGVGARVIVRARTSTGLIAAASIEAEASSTPSSEVTRPASSCCGAASTEGERIAGAGEGEGGG